MVMKIAGFLEESELSTELGQTLSLLDSVSFPVFFFTGYYGNMDRKIIFKTTKSMLEYLQDDRFRVSEPIYDINSDTKDVSTE